MAKPLATGDCAVFLKELPGFSEACGNDMIHTTSGGCPRAVSNLSPQAPVAAFATVGNLVDEAAARAAVSEVVGD